MNGSCRLDPRTQTLQWQPDGELAPSIYVQARALGFRRWASLRAWVAPWTPEREAFVLRFVERIER